VLLTKYYWGNQIKKSKMGGTYSTIRERRGAYWVLLTRNFMICAPHQVLLGQ